MQRGPAPPSPLPVPLVAGTETALCHRESQVVIIITFHFLYSCGDASGEEKGKELFSAQGSSSQPPGLLKMAPHFPQTSEAYRTIFMAPWTLQDQVLPL